MDLRREKLYYKNKYILHENHAEIIILDKYGEEHCRALIDKEIIDEIKHIKWYKGSQGYIMGHCDKKRNRTLHKVITKTGSREFVDHINGNRLDNRKCNLRIVNAQQNAMNHPTPKNNKSGFRGVRIYKSGRFGAYITYNKKRINLGAYDTFEEAKQARINAEEKYFKEYAYKHV